MTHTNRKTTHYLPKKLCMTSQCTPPFCHIISTKNKLHQYYFLFNLRFPMTFARFKINFAKKNNKSMVERFLVIGYMVYVNRDPQDKCFCQSLEMATSTFIDIATIFTCNKQKCETFLLSHFFCILYQPVCTISCKG